MKNSRLYSMKFSTLYDLYKAKLNRKNRSLSDLDDFITWLFNLSIEQMLSTQNQNLTLEELLTKFSFNSDAYTIKGKICGVSIDSIEDPIMKKIRIMDKGVDMLYQGKSLNVFIHNKKEL